VACPRCNERFPVEPSGNGTKANYYPPGTNPFPPGVDPPPRGAAAHPPVGPPAPPPRSASSPGAARFRGAPEMGAATSAAAPQPPPGPPLAPPPAMPSGAPSPSLHAPQAPPPPVQGPAPPDSKPAQRSVKQARFITAGETATHMRLGADGQLPQLALREGEQREKKSEEKQGMSPLILVVLLVSVAASAAILFLPDQSQGDSRSKAAARKDIETYYIETRGSIDPASANKPYQRHLREALQAHSRRDFRTERSHYRHVMNLLKSEGISKTTGLTGQIGETLNSSENPPVRTDRHLEKLLSILLSD